MFPFLLSLIPVNNPFGPFTFCPVQNACEVARQFYTEVPWEVQKFLFKGSLGVGGIFVVSKYLMKKRNERINRLTIRKHLGNIGATLGLGVEAGQNADAANEETIRLAGEWLVEKIDQLSTWSTEQKDEMKRKIRAVAGVEN